MKLQATAAISPPPIFFPLVSHGGAHHSAANAVSERNLQRKITKTRQQLQQKELAKLKIFIVWAPRRGGSTNLHHRPDQPTSIPFGHPPQSKTTRISVAHRRNEKTNIFWPNGTYASQEQEESKYAFPESPCTSRMRGSRRGRRHVRGDLMVRREMCNGLDERALGIAAEMIFGENACRDR